MNQLTLTTTAQRPLQPLVEAALNIELRMLEAAIQRTEKKIRGYETVHDMSSAHFVQRFENDDLPESLEFAEWMG
jgi:predicted N-acyltransferase